MEKDELNSNDEKNIEINQENSTIENNEIIEENTKKKSKKGIIIVIILLILLSSLGVLFYFNKDRVLNYVSNLKSNGKVNNSENNETNNNDNNNNNEPEVIETEVELKKSEYVISKNSLDNFDLAFLKLENEEKNMIYSPLSIKYALGMLMTGASGDSKKQISEVLGKYKFHKFKNNKNMSFANAMFIKNSFKDSIKKSFIDSLTKNFGADVKYDSFKSPDVVNKYVSDKTFNLVNGIVDNIKDFDYILLNALAIDMNWVHRIQTDYGEMDDDTFKNDEVYGYYPEHLEYYTHISPLNETDYHQLSFNGDGIRRQSVQIGAVINNYNIVKILGKDKIKKIVMDEYNKWVKEGAPNSCGECEYNEETDEEICEPDPFDFNAYLKELDSNYGQTESSTDFELYYDDNVKVFKKNLRKYGDTTLQYVGIMPTQVKLKDYIKTVTEADINKLIKSTKSIKSKNFKEDVITEINGYIPLFNFDYELKLKEDLDKIGITDVFNSAKADLSNLTKSKSYIDNALHKAQIEFTNDGIKAAAVTTLGGMGAGDCGWDYFFLPPVEKVDITFDKPFLFLIIDKDTEEVWFTGKVYEPDKYKSYDSQFKEKYPNYWDNYDDDDDDYDDDDDDYDDDDNDYDYDDYDDDDEE